MTTFSVFFRLHLPLTALLSICLLTFSVQTAQAESYLAMYLGLAQTKDADISVIDTSVFPAESAVRNLDYDSSGSFGLRGGAWGDVMPFLGMAMDLSYFEADADEVTFDVVPLSVLFMLRWPISDDVTRETPKFAPYLGFGPSLVAYDMDIDLRPAISDTISEWSIDLGWDARGGISWMTSDRLGLFVEYRYTHFSVDYEKTSIIPARVVTEVDTDLATQHVLCGLSFHY